MSDMQQGKETPQMKVKGREIRCVDLELGLYM